MSATIEHEKFLKYFNTNQVNNLKKINKLLI